MIMSAAIIKFNEQRTTISNLKTFKNDYEKLMKTSKTECEMFSECNLNQLDKENKKKNQKIKSNIK